MKTYLVKENLYGIKKYNTKKKRFYINFMAQ